jgi:hypothetical protein
MEDQRIKLFATGVSAQFAGPGGRQGFLSSQH